MEEGAHSGLKSVLFHETTRTWITVGVLVMGLCVEWVLAGKRNTLPPQPTVHVQFRGPCDQRPSIHVLIDSEEASMTPDGSVDVLPGLHKIKCYYLDSSKLAMLTSEYGERGAVLRLRLDGLALLHITVTRE